MKLLASIGNMKLGNDTLILNITSATDCPSRELGFCKLGSKCYAMKAERIYKHPLEFRRAQTAQWDNNIPETLIQMILPVTQKRGVQYIRFSESGDFRDQADVDKMSTLADILTGHNLKMYGYTARQDLDFSQVSDNMVVNGSGFMMHNQFTATDNPQNNICPMNCRICDMCKAKGNLNIEAKVH